MADWRHFVDTLARRAAGGQHAAEAERSEPAPAPTTTAPAESFRDVVDAPVGDDAAPKPLAQPPLDLAVGVVSRENRKIKSSDVAEILRREGHDVKNVVISNALVYGAKRADPPRVKQAQGRGYYAPMEYVESPIAVNPVLNGKRCRHVGRAKLESTRRTERVRGWDWKRLPRRLPVGASGGPVKRATVA